MVDFFCWMKPHTWDHGGGVSYERWDYWVERWQWHISFWFGTAEEQNFGCVDSPWSRQTKDITTWVYRTRHPKYYPIAWYISSKFSKSGWMSFTNKHIFMLFRFRDIPWLTFRLFSQGFFARMERSMLAADAERVVAVTKLDGRGSRHGDYQIEIL